MTSTIRGLQLSYVEEEREEGKEGGREREGVMRARNEEGRREEGRRRKGGREGLSSLK